MLVTVTGAAGFVGRAVVERLAGSGHRIRAVVRSENGPSSAAETVIAGDLTSADVSKLFRGCESVVNCAARVHILRREDPNEALAAYREANRELPLRLARAARESGVQTFVQLSSLAAIASTSRQGEVISDATPPRPDRPYGIAKREADEELLALSRHGFRVVCLRPPAVFGPGVGAWFALLDRVARMGMPLPIGNIANYRSFIAAANLADAVAAALTRPVSGAYIVTDSLPLATADLYRQLLQMHGHADRVWHWPVPLVRLAARAILGSRAESLLGDAACDGTRFAADASWTPPLTFAEALAATVGDNLC